MPFGPNAAGGDSLRVSKLPSVKGNFAAIVEHDRSKPVEGRRRPRERLSCHGDDAKRAGCDQ